MSLQISSFSLIINTFSALRIALDDWKRIFQDFAITKTHVTFVMWVWLVKFCVRIIEVSDNRGCTVARQDQHAVCITYVQVYTPFIKALENTTPFTRKLLLLLGQTLISRNPDLASVNCTDKFYEY